MEIVNNLPSDIDRASGLLGYWSFCLSDSLQPKTITFLVIIDNFINFFMSTKLYI